MRNSSADRHSSSRLRRAWLRGIAALLVVTTVFHLGPAVAAPGDIFSTPAPVIGGSAPKAADLTTGDTTVSSQTGALQYSYPIRVPPGRQGAAPSLALAYSSQAPIYGGPAAGWSLPVPKILWDTGRGRLRTHYGDFAFQQGVDAPLDDRFLSTMAGSRSLVQVPEPFLDTDVYRGYRAQADSSFTRYERMNPTAVYRWRARDTGGTTYYFGDTANAPGCPISDGYAPLTRTVDQFGNEVSYFYVLANRECILSEIRWGKNALAGLQDFASVEVKTQRAAECPGGPEVGSSLDYRTGVPITTGTNYITSVIVKAFDPATNAVVHTRTLTLSYWNASSPSNSESCTTAGSPVRLLRSIQESAVGVDSPQVDLPAVTFTYGSPFVDQSVWSTISTTPWQDTLSGLAPPRQNLGWGIRRQNGDDRWPTVEAMMIDIDGDGMLDRVQNAWVTSGGVTTCRASWQRGIPGSTLSFGAQQLLSWGNNLTNYRMPMLRWNGAQEPPVNTPNPGSSQADQAFPRFEGCALNGQVTFFHNSHPNNNLCHDNVTPCVAEPSGNGGQYCPLDGNACGPGASIPPDRTYLAYRWMDMDGDGLVDLVAGIHGSVDRYDVVRGNDVALNSAYEPSLFGTVPIPNGLPPCANLADRCKSLRTTTMSSGASCDGPGACTFNWGLIHEALAQAADDECELEIGQMNLAKVPGGQEGNVGNPTAHMAPRKPYKMCAGLYPWFIFKNRGNGNFNDTPDIKYQPIPLESDNGDSSLTGGVSATHEGILDIDGDGLVDGVAQARDADPTSNPLPWWWFAWLNDGTGGLGPTRYVWPARNYPIGAINGFSTSTSTIGASMGLIDINGDGLSDHWNATGTATSDIAYNTGTEFRLSGFHQYGDLVTQIKPAAENWITTLTPPVNGFRRDGRAWAHSRVVDLDSDGRPDLLTSANEVPSWLNFNNGGQFLPAVTPPSNYGFNGGPRVVHATYNNPAVGSELHLWQLISDLIDLDGDGLPESANWDGFGNLQLQKHSLASGPPRLLTSINNGRGATTAVTYASMHDPTAVKQAPGTVVAGRPKATPQNQWVVKSLTTTETIPTTQASTTSYLYERPVHGRDDDGRYAFRGFETVTTTSPSNSLTVQTYSYDPDWSGRLAKTVVKPSASEGSDVKTIDETTWDDFTLFGGLITTYHPITTQHFVCLNGQTEATCTAAAAPGYTRTISTFTALAASGSGNQTPLLWQETDTLLQSGAALGDAENDRATKRTFWLAADATTYRLRQTATNQTIRKQGTPITYAKSAATWDPTYRMQLTDEQWFDNVLGNRAVTRFEYYEQTGNLKKRWKPMQNAANTTYTLNVYDSRELFVASETNELGHVRDYSYEYGTGTKLQTLGPNARVCVTGCSGPAQETHKIRVDGLGRMIERWETFSGDGYNYVYSKVETNDYVDSIASGPRSILNKQLLDIEGIVWKQDKTELDGHGRVFKQTAYVQGSAPADAVTTFQYNADGTLASVKVPDPTLNSAATVTYTYTYDSLGRPKSLRRPDAASQSGVDMTYDGVTTTTTEVAGTGGGQVAITKTENDRFGRLSRVHEKSSSSTWAITTYTYDGNDQVESVTDPQSFVTTMSHDFAGRRTQITRAGRSWTLTYDKNGNVLAELVPGSPGAGSDYLYTNTTVYDDLDRPTSRIIGPRALSDPDQTAFGNKSEVFVYDVDGNMKGQLRQWYTYDPSSAWTVGMDLRVDAQGKPSGTILQTRLPNLPFLTRWIYESWYATGPRQHIRHGDVMGPTYDTWSQTFLDPRGLPSYVNIYNHSDSQPTTTQTMAQQTRNVAGLVTNRRSYFPNGTNYVESNWQYDKLGRVVDQTVQKGPTISTVAKQTLTYHGADDPKTLVHVINGGSSKTFTYGYDLRHQLKTVTTNTSSYYGGTFSYGEAGRFASANVSQTGSAPPGTEVKTRNVNYVYGDADPERVTALTNVSNGSRYATFTYDAAGNMTSKCMGPTYTPTCTGEYFEYVYDGKDHLRRATRKMNNAVTGSEEYWYDKDGQRIAVLKKDAAGNKTELVEFLKDTEAHYNGAGTALTHVYSHATMGTPVARVTRTSDTATTTELQFHGLASNTLATVDRTSAAVNASFRYGGLGEVLEAADGVGLMAHRRRFNDKQQDELTGLGYYGARYYDKVLVGWTQSDPLYRFAPDMAWTRPRNALLYSANLNNPLRYLDPDGRQSVGVITWGQAVSGAASAGAGVGLGTMIAVAGPAAAAVILPAVADPHTGVTTGVTHEESYDRAQLARAQQQEARVDQANANQVLNENNSKNDQNQESNQTTGRATNTSQDSVAGPPDPGGGPRKRSAKEIRAQNQATTAANKKTNKHTNVGSKENQTQVKSPTAQDLSDKAESIRGSHEENNPGKTEQRMREQLIIEAQQGTDVD